MNPAHKHLIDQTLHSTPKPRASSTAQKKQLAKQLILQKVPLTFSPNSSHESSAESLGILNLENLQLTSQLNSSDVQPQISNERLQEQRLLTMSLLQKTGAKNYDLPTRYLKISDTLKTTDSAGFGPGSESTVNESDLVGSTNKSTTASYLVPENVLFTPADISTPRSSCASDLSVSSRLSMDKKALSKHLAELSQEIRKPSSNIADLCEQITRCNSLDGLQFSQSFQFEEEEDSFQFESGYQAFKKLAKHEDQWKKQLDALGGRSRSDSMFSRMSNSSFSTVDGVSEFFRKKSELAELCFKNSPKKTGAPTPLIDETCENLEPSIAMPMMSSTSTDNSLSLMKTAGTVDESVLSITEIEKAISANDNTAQIMDYIFGNPTSSKALKLDDKPKQKVPRHQPSLVSNISQSNNYKENQDPLENAVNLDDKPMQKIPRRQSSLLSNNQSNYKQYQDLHEEPSRDYSAKSRSSSLEPLKEFPSNCTDKSANSSMRTASSLESLPGGKLPIETSRIELVWSCIPVGKRKTQTFTLRNRSQNKLKVQMTSSNESFRILNDHSEADPVSNLPVLLHPAESRSVSVMFMPSVVGAMVGKLNFAPVDHDLQMQQTKRQQLMMYGYGGYSNVEIQDVSKDTNMKMWLPLGKLNSSSQFHQKFILRNIGSLPAFACLGFGSKKLYGYSKVTIYPTELILKPKEQTVVNVSYTPTKDDAKHAFAETNNPVIEMGYIRLISGEEALRGRIRRLCRKLKQEAGVVGDPIIERLSNKFPNEKIPTDLRKISETVGCMKELLQNLVSREIILTLEKDCERSLIGQIVGIDDTSMFHSLAEGMPTMMSSMYPIGSCTVEPLNLMLTPPMKIEDSVLLSSQSSKALQFEVSMAGDVLDVMPSAGILAPGENVFLKITCDVRKLQPPQQQQVYKILIFVDDEVFEVGVKVILVKCGVRK